MSALYVVIPVRDRLEYTRPLVETLLEQDELDGLYLADNGSIDGTRQWAEALAKRDQRICVASHPGVGIHAMWNAGLDWAREQSRRPRVALLNNDLAVGPHFLSRLARALDDPRIGVAGGNYDGRRSSGGQPYIAVETICGNRYDGTGGLPGFAMMLRGEEGYRFPEALHWWYGDTDLLFTTLARGRMAVIVQDATCTHLDGGGRTGDWRSPAMQRLVRQDRIWFMEKWRGVAA